MATVMELVTRPSDTIEAWRAKYQMVTTLMANGFFWVPEKPGAILITGWWCNPYRGLYVTGRPVVDYYQGGQSLIEELGLVDAAALPQEGVK